ncbi:hypothetical protein ACHAW5_008952 [Stephanodiscus triporus]|uniref:Uncharacterized protein n=1 Tax=Stephanodiscus triporus TaxID=2934178 RepID=A0ABD3NQI3_9STRA
MPSSSATVVRAARPLLLLLRPAASASASPSSYLFSHSRRGAAAASFSSSRKFAPLGDRVLVRRSIKETMTSGGILLPSDNVKESNEGIVVSVGPGARDDTTGNMRPLCLKVGDSVLLPKYGGTEVEVGDEKMSLYREEDILGKFE